MQTLAPTWNLSDTATQKWYVRVFPSLNDVAFLLPIFLLYARFGGTGLLFTDGDTGWHIRTGEWILAHHAVPRVDLFSFSNPNQPWFAWEWAWDAAFAVIHSATGLAGIAFANTLLIGVFTLLVYRLAFAHSNNHLTSMLVTALTAGASSLHWLARPHLFSWIFALIFLLLIRAATTDGRHLLYTLPALMILWVNVHGGFIAGLLIVGCYALGETLGALLEANGHLPTALRRSARWWQSLGLCVAATLINPYGLKLHSHIYTYLTDAELLDKIQEFQSISFHAGPAVLFEIMLVLGAFVVYTRLQRRQFAPALLLCFWAHFALLSARHIPIFMLVAAPFVAELLAEAVVGAGHIPALASVTALFNSVADDLRALEATPRLPVLSAAALLLIGGLFAAGQPPFAAQFNPEMFPVQAMPIIERHRGSRIFTTDQWADYLLYRFYPVQRVFFDGRSDFYGNDFVKVNQRIAGAEHDWKTLLQRFGIQLVMLKPEMPLSAVLKLTPAASVLFDDGKVIVFDVAHIYRAVANRRLAPAAPPARNEFYTSSGRRDSANRATSSASVLPSGIRPDGSLHSPFDFATERKNSMISTTFLKKFWQEEEGQDLVEYSLLLAFIALAAVGLLSGTRTTISGLWSTINTTLASASTTAS